MAASQFLINQQIEHFIQDQDEAKKSYSADQIAYINQYTGSGGMGSKGATGSGLLHEFFTPEYVCELMWELALHYGFRENGTVLEPACATGRLFKNAPDLAQCEGFEINPTSARIAELTYPQTRIYRSYFETAFLQPPRYTTKFSPMAGRGNMVPTWLRGYPFDLVIGNPPYGAYQNEYSGYFPEIKRLGVKQIEIFFMLKGLQLLKPGGLLVFITGSSFLRNGVTYETAKKHMATLCDVKDAYRLPPVFDTTKVPTDILVFQRK